MKKAKSSKAGPAARSAAKRSDHDHHLVANRGFWWVCCSINATPRTKEKLGFSLGTKCVETARLRRDLFLQGLHREGLEVRIRRHSPVNLGPVAAPRPNFMVESWQARVERTIQHARAAELPGGSPQPEVVRRSPRRTSRRRERSSR